MPFSVCRRPLFAACIVLCAVWSASAAFASSDTAAEFALLLKNEDYASAYEMLSPALKGETGLAAFEVNQREAKTNFREEFGSGVILRVEEVVLLKEQALRAQKLNLGGFLEGLFMPWREAERQRAHRIFQFVFFQEQKVLFAVDTAKTQDGGRVVTNYQFVPYLQKMIAAGDPQVQIKEIRILDEKK